jgi:hypothetical protein
VAGVQHVWLSALEQISPEGQFPLQVTSVFVHGSVNAPQYPAGHVFGVQQVF